MPESGCEGANSAQAQSILNEASFGTLHLYSRGRKEAIMLCPKSQVVRRELGSRLEGGRVGPREGETHMLFTSVPAAFSNTSSVTSRPGGNSGCFGKRETGFGVC